jgi:dienelactone hydrolase
VTAVRVQQGSATFAVGGRPYAIDRYVRMEAAVPRPAVVVVHGIDGLSGASGAAIRSFAEQVALEGYLVLVPHYFDSNDGADSAPLEQLVALRATRTDSYRPRLAAAVALAMADSDAAPGGMGLVGFSLGGGLAIDHAETAVPGTVKVLVDFFGHIFSPALLANVDRLPPTLVLHNRGDAVVALASSSQPLVDALKKRAVPHQHTFYTDANPGSGNHPFLPGGPADIDARSKAVAWLKAHLAVSH